MCHFHFFFVVGAMCFVTNIKICGLRCRLSNRGVSFYRQSAAAAAADVAAALCCNGPCFYGSSADAAASCGCSSSCAGWQNMLLVH